MLLVESSRPAVAQTYAIAGRSLLVHSPSAEIAAATERIFSMLRLANADQGSGPTATLKLLVKSFELPGEAECSAANEEAEFYQTSNSYFAKLQSSVVAADESLVVTIYLSPDVDYNSFLFGRVLSYGLGAALRRLGAFELHCAAVVEPRSKAAALIVGGSGSGKSTLTLQLAASGWDFSTDDVVLLTDNGERIDAHGLRQFFLLTAETIRRINLPALEALRSGRSDETLKTRFYPTETFNTEMLSECEPSFLIFASRTGESVSRVNRLSQTDIMKRLMRIAPWSSVDRSIAGKLLNLQSKLARQCQGYDLAAGLDLIADPAYTADFVSAIVSKNAS
jgi:hypothetical protein